MLDRRLVERPVRAVLLDPADVDDAVQATLITVASRIGSFERRARFTTWLDRVARNEALMVLRRKKRLSEPVSNEVPENDRSARRLSSLVANERVLEVAMEELSPEHRQVIVMREVEALSYEEIAERVGVPVGTVRSRINRARSTLADLLLSTRHDF